MGHRSLHIMELLSVQCLQFYDAIHLLLLLVYCGFGRCGSQGFTWWCYNVAEWNIELDFDHVMWL